ncbi:MAG: hypothetical protein KAT35_01345, partial [Candidatus Aenigmarchaeota archaeon]|nr:hypothetical protein [Candidatus Aenigmarchaeota archaeon]
MTASDRIPSSAAPTGSGRRAGKREDERGVFRKALPFVIAAGTTLLTVLGFVAGSAHNYNTSQSEERIGALIDNHAEAKNLKDWQRKLVAEDNVPEFWESIFTAYVNEAEVDWAINNAAILNKQYDKRLAIMKELNVTGVSIMSDQEGLAQLENLIVRMDGALNWRLSPAYQPGSHLPGGELMRVYANMGESWKRSYIAMKAAQTAAEKYRKLEEKVKVLGDEENKYAKQGQDLETVSAEKADLERQLET